MNQVKDILEWVEKGWKDWKIELSMNRHFWYRWQLIEKDPEKRRLMAGIELGVEALGQALTAYQHSTWEKYKDVWEVDKDGFMGWKQSEMYRFFDYHSGQIKRTIVHQKFMLSKKMVGYDLFLLLILQYLYLGAPTSAAIT